MVLFSGRLKMKDRNGEVITVFNPKVYNAQTERLMEAILAIGNKEDAYRFFEDLCTIPEIKSIAQRLEVAWLLRKKETYQRIAEETGASSATISRVNRALSYGADGYNRVLDRMEENRETDGGDEGAAIGEAEGANIGENGGERESFEQM